MPKNKEDQDILYIFLHIPKTAGNTFLYHLENKFREEERIRLYEQDLPELKFSLSTTEKTKEIIYKRFFSLTKRQKDKIKIIYGHLSYYGIHKFFNKPYRYITFVRNPVDRTVSTYNYFSTLQKNNEKFSKANLLINEKIPSFENWLKIKYSKKLTIPAFLKRPNYLGKNLKESLNKFYFIGITENYNEDAVYLYHLLGINKFYTNKNISKKYVKLEDLDKKTKDLLMEKNKEDIELYNYALELNKKFKQEHPEFYPIVNYMKIKRILMLPFTLQNIYELSFWLKKYSRSYSKFIKFIKREIKCCKKYLIK